MNIELGGKADSPAIGKIGRPVRISGTVRNLSDGAFTITGPMYSGVTAYMVKPRCWRAPDYRLWLRKSGSSPLMWGFSPAWA